MAKPQIPSLNWLRVFEAAANHGSFARAARALNMSPPAISQQIRSLEGYLGAPLFSRQAHSVTLTDEGKAFLPSVQHALGIIATSTTAVFDRSDQQDLVIQVTALFAYSWLSERLENFADMHPDIRLHVHLGEYTEDFIRYKTDLQISYGPGPWEKAYSDRLFGEVIFPVATAHISAQILKAEDLLAFPLLEVQQHNLGWFQALQNLGLASQQEPRWRFVQNTPLAFSFAAASPAVALARAPASDELQARYGLQRCLADHPPLQGLHEYSLRHTGVDRLSPAAQLFREWLLSQLPQE